MAQRSVLGVLLGLGLMVVVGCGRSETASTGAGEDGGGEHAESLSGSIAIDGSSTVYPVTEAVAEEFQNSTGGKVRVTVGIKGTGGGFKAFTRGETDVSNASRPILAEEMEAAKANGIKYIELPVCFDALTVVVNPQNDWVDHLTIEELKKMWEPAAQGKVTRWNQIRPNWPDEELALFGPGADSGTFDYFTEAVVGKAKSSRGDFTASEDDNVLVQGVAGNKYALGYFGYAYYPPNEDKLKAVPIDWEKDEEGPTLPSMDTVLKGTYNPLSRPLFIYVSAKSAERPEVQKFVEFYLENVPQLASEVKYVPLPEQAYAAAKERFEKRQTGTAFGGVPEVGLPVEEILKREPKE
jgi:phosphate transport system substrate-binding protein